MTHDFKKYPELANNQMGFYYLDSPHQQIAEDFWAKVVRVKDGDTIQVKCDFRNFNFPVRISNIMSPEMNEPGGKESQSWLESQILGKEVEIKVNPNNRVEKWGRLLGSVENLGFDVGEESKAEGMSLSLKEEKSKMQELVEFLIITKEWQI